MSTVTKREVKVEKVKVEITKPELKFERAYRTVGDKKRHSTKSTSACTTDSDTGAKPR